MKTITVEATVNAPLEKVWKCWTEPEHITQWCFASDDWEAPYAENELRIGGEFKTRMQAKDGSTGFDFGGTYTAVEEGKHIAYDFGDRHTDIVFEEVADGIKITETFDPENENPEDMQRAGWQSIIDNFKKHVEQE